MRELYARGSAVSSDGQVEATVGIEIRDDDVDELTNYARRVCRRAVSWAGGNHVALVICIESCVKQDYPGRAYFIETEEEGKGVQVFDPRDFVKTRCTCTCATPEPLNPNQLELPSPEPELAFDPEVA